jgi:hypothetical protein
MCGLCGVFLGESNWSDAAVTSTSAGGRTRRHERLHRVALANRVVRHYGIKVSDWNGSSYLVSTATGQTEIVSSIAAVWPVAERLRKQSLDPLDEQLIAQLERASGLTGGERDEQPVAYAAGVDEQVSPVSFEERARG